MRKVCEYIYAGVCVHVACTCMGSYVYVCGHMSMDVSGPITPCGLTAGGAVFHKE